MAEPKHARIVDAILARLAGIVSDAGVTYWYAPNLVAAVHHFEDAYLDPKHDVSYLLMDLDETHAEEATGMRGSAVAEFLLLVAKRFAPPMEQAGGADTRLRMRIVDRLVRDALRVLLLEPTLGGLTTNLMTDGMVVDRSLVFKGWALAEIRFAVPYSYTWTATAGLVEP